MAEDPPFAGTNVRPRQVPVPAPASTDAQLEEVRRLKELDALDLLDTEPEHPDYDLILMAADVCQAPVAALNLVAGDRQWSKAIIGLQRRDVPREQSFCARAIEHPDTVYVIEDIDAEERWAHRTAGDGLDHLRFYAGAAIVTRSGHAVGTVCVGDFRPRTLSGRQERILLGLAGQASALCAFRAANHELIEVTRRLHTISAVDELTNLTNRRACRASIKRLIAQQARGETTGAIVLADVDDFKAINDTFGHRVGDHVLQTLAHRLKLITRATDMACRWGGDEFVVVCSAHDMASRIEDIIARYERELATAFTFPSRDIASRVSVSFGAALIQPGDDPESVLERADHAMYTRKRGARHVT